MKNKKFRRLILALKLYLILAIVFSLVEAFNGFVSGWKSYDTEISKGKKVASNARQQVAVIPLNDTSLYEGVDYRVTAVKAFRIQERNDVDHTTTYRIIELCKLILAFTGLIFLVKFLRKSFALLKQLEKFVILDKSNLLLLNKAAYNLLIAGVAINAFVLISTIYNSTWFHLDGYRIDYLSDFDPHFILTALLLLILSWIIKFAIELKEENDLTI